MIRKASLSRCGQYRYSLSRQWDASLGTVCFIGLNPSTADAYQDDPTIRRCIGFAKSWGYGGLIIVNVFAFRTPYPNALKQADEPIGPRNAHYLNLAKKTSDLQVAIWGNDGTFLNQAARIQKRFENLHVIRMNQSGQPAHPLYLPKQLKPIPWPKKRAG